MAGDDGLMHFGGQSLGFADDADAPVVAQQAGETGSCRHQSVGSEREGVPVVCDGLRQGGRVELGYRVWADVRVVCPAQVEVSERHEVQLFWFDPNCRGLCVALALF